MAAGDWRPPIVPTVAIKGEGSAELLAALDEHAAHLEATGRLRERRLARARDEIEAIALTALRERFTRLSGDARLDVLAGRLVAAEIDPYGAADELLADVARG
jgi:LAO/AO transport system kinase